MVFTKKELKNIIKEALMEASFSKEDFVKLGEFRKNLNLANQLTILAQAKTFLDAEKYEEAAKAVDQLNFATKRVNEEFINVLKVMQRKDAAGEYDK
jgi:predicted phage-related endonuclease